MEHKISLSTQSGSSFSSTFASHLNALASHSRHMTLAERERYRVLSFRSFPSLFFFAAVRDTKSTPFPQAGQDDVRIRRGHRERVDRPNCNSALASFLPAAASTKAYIK